VGRHLRADHHSPLTADQGLPPCTPGLNPVEGIWSLLRRGFLVNGAFADADHLVQTVRHGLRKIQYRPQLIDGYLAATGLTTDITNSTRVAASGIFLRRPGSHRTAYLLGVVAMRRLWFLV
jgi:hypothetical protein